MSPGLVAVVCAVLAVGSGTIAGSGLGRRDASPLPEQTGNPTPYTVASISRGKTFFLQNCQSCHDEDGRARSAAIAIAADLTDPDRWKFGTSDAQVFGSIKNGAVDAMPPFGGDLKGEQIWDAP